MRVILLHVSLKRMISVYDNITILSYDYYIISLKHNSVVISMFSRYSLQILLLFFFFFLHQMMQSRRIQTRRNEVAGSGSCVSVAHNQ